MSKLVSRSIRHIGPTKEEIMAAKDNGDEITLGEDKHVVTGFTKLPASEWSWGIMTKTDGHKYIGDYNSHTQAVHLRLNDN